MRSSGSNVRSSPETGIAVGGESSGEIEVELVEIGEAARRERFGAEAEVEVRAK